jgi:hypothetical protein
VFPPVLPYLFLMSPVIFPVVYVLLLGLGSVGPSVEVVLVNVPGVPTKTRVSCSEPVFVDVYGHLGIDSKNRFHMKN